MQNNGDESLILIDEEGEVIDDDDDDCQVIEDASGGAALRDLFVVDTNHIHEEHNEALVLGEHLEIHRIVMPTNGEEQQEASRSRKSGGSMSCFNCGGAHTLNECPEPKDQRRISQNRAARYNRNQGRFHEEVADKNHRAGYISEELREALGLRYNELPGWIYRMRRKGFIDGYPPAYLKRSVTELLNFIHADSEEGEVEDQASMPKTVDAEKIVRYPGFNVPPPRNCRNMEPGYRVPPMENFVQAHQLNLDRVLKEKRQLKMLEEAQKTRKRKAEANVPRLDSSVSSSSSVEVIETPDGPKFAEDSEQPSAADEVTTPAKKVRTEGPVSVGTPVFMRRSAADSETEPEATKPALEAFAEGVVPFQAKEESSEHKGFFNKIMGMVKGLKKKK